MTFTPAAAKTISDFLRDTNTLPSDYDMILTGDLGLVGSRLLRELMLRESNIDLSSVHQDCGLMIFDRNNQALLNRIKTVSEHKSVLIYIYLWVI